MSTPTAAITKPLSGTLFIKEAVNLAPAEDGTARTMGVLQVATADEGVVRVTDFSKQHEALVVGQPINLVYEQSEGVRNERPVVYRNLVTAVQA